MAKNPKPLRRREARLLAALRLNSSQRQLLSLMTKRTSMDWKDRFTLIEALRTHELGDLDDLVITVDPVTHRCCVEHHPSAQ